MCWLFSPPLSAYRNEHLPDRLVHHIGLQKRRHLHHTDQWQILLRVSILDHTISRHICIYIFVWEIVGEKPVLVERKEELINYNAATEGSGGGGSHCQFMQIDAESTLSLANGAHSPSPTTNNICHQLELIHWIISISFGVVCQSKRRQTKENDKKREKRNYAWWSICIDTCPWTEVEAAAEAYLAWNLSRQLTNERNNTKHKRRSEGQRTAWTAEEEILEKDAKFVFLEAADRQRDRESGRTQRWTLANLGESSPCTQLRAFGGIFRLVFSIFRLSFMHFSSLFCLFCVFTLCINQMRDCECVWNKWHVRST